MCLRLAGHLLFFMVESRELRFFIVLPFGSCHRLRFGDYFFCVGLCYLVLVILTVQFLIAILLDYIPHSPCTPHEYLS
jgi:hypothetical protein